MIIANQLHKSFKRQGSSRRSNPAEQRIVAVNSVSFTAEDGRITGLLGPNGAGKSTTLRMLATLVKPEKGEASIDGHDVSREVLLCTGIFGICGLFSYILLRGRAGTTRKVATDALEQCCRNAVQGHTASSRIMDGRWLPPSPLRRRI